MSRVDHPRYRTTLLLAGLVVMGWAWDVALGGGRAHSAAWLGALVVVVGVSGLAARAATGDQAPLLDSGSPPPQVAAPDPARPHQIRLAEPDELAHLVEVEVAADKLFEVAGYGATPGPASIAELAAARLLLVAGRPAVGYIRVEEVDGQAHIEGLSVRPNAMRRGVGSALVEAACRWAAEQGFRTVTLCTFADIAWNGPFYSGLGFREVAKPSAGLRALRESEARLGLDAMGRRWVMARDLAG